jgi:hypothetical protein
MNTPFLTFYYDYDQSKYYESSANRLKTQIESFGGRLIIEQPKLIDSYLLNCMEKPKIILNILNKIKNPLIWIDADCYIRKLPKEFDNLNECDIGFILRNHDYKTPHSAIIYFNYNENVVRFIKKWIEKCEQEKQNILNGTYKCGDHCKLIETFNEIDDINYQFMSPLFASTNLLESMISIGISPGGHLVELNK